MWLSMLRRCPARGLCDGIGDVVATQRGGSTRPADEVGSSAVPTAVSLGGPVNTELCGCAIPLRPCVERLTNLRVYAGGPFRTPSTAGTSVETRAFSIAASSLEKPA